MNEMPAWMVVLMPKVTSFIVTLIVGMLTAWKIELDIHEQQALATGIGLSLAFFYGILKTYLTARWNPYNVSSPEKLKEIKNEEKVNGNQ